MKDLILAAAMAAALATSQPALAAEDTASDVVARGRYMTLIAACHDCHSPGYLASSGKTDERKTWLTGDVVGWYSPQLGTTYPPNLRLLAASVDEATFLARSRSDKLRPPMPWFQAREIKDGDLRAIYRYIRSLGPAGTAAPAALPPGPPPNTPYFKFPQAPGQ